MEIATVKWFRTNHPDPRQQIGFFVLEDGSELFAHWASRRGFTSSGTEPQFSHGYPDRVPVSGDKVRYELGKSRNGKPRADFWGYDDDYLAAEAEIKRREIRVRELADKLRSYAEEVRLRCNPRFRLVEQEERFRKPTDKAASIVFVGTRQSLYSRINPPQYLNVRPLQVTSGKTIDGFQYVRWFERETADGWERCDDPTILELPPLQKLPIEAACALASLAVLERQETRYHNGFSYKWVALEDGAKKNLAHSVHSYVTGLEIEFPESDWYQATLFSGEEVMLLLANFKEAINIPMPPRYSYSW